jgi:imidazolonepropionase-like amidohydrolase
MRRRTVLRAGALAPVLGARVGLVPTRAFGQGGGEGAATRQTATSFALTHARLHDGAGKVIEDGTIVVRAGEIVAVGGAAAVQPPAGLRVIDGRGLWVTPGLFDAESRTGLVDVVMEASAADMGLDERYDAVRAALRVEDGFNPDAVNLPITRMEGVTHAALAPRGGLIAGRGAVVRLHGRRIEDALLRAPSAVYASLAGGGRAAAFGTRGGVMLRLREVLDDARQFRRRREDFERNQMRRVAASRLDLEALVPVIDGQLPLVLEAHRASDLRAALRLARDERVSLMLCGAEEGHLVADEIAEAKVPVIVSALPNLPRAFEALGAHLENAARLARAGVALVLSPREDEFLASRTLRLEAGNAVANGLPWQVALAAVTSVPAKVFGLGDRVGTLAVGREASLVAWSGDPFEPLTRPRHVFIAGHEQPLRSRQTELRDRYRSGKGSR